MHSPDGQVDERVAPRQPSMVTCVGHNRHTANHAGNGRVVEEFEQASFARHDRAPPVSGADFSESPHSHDPPSLYPSPDQLSAEYDDDVIGARSVQCAVRCIE